jgi:competence protein ComEC
MCVLYFFSVPPGILCLLSLVLAGVGISLHSYKSFPGKVLISLSIGVFFAATALLRLEYEEPYTGIPLDRVSGFSGIVLTDARPCGGGLYRMTLRLKRVYGSKEESANARGIMTLFVRNRPGVRWGMDLTVEAPLIESGENQRTAWAGIEEIDINGWANPVVRIRSQVLLFIEKKISSLGKDPGDLFIALFLGIQDPDSPLRKQFREAGAAHVLALSGMHLGIITGLILIALKPFTGKRAALLISCPVVVAYLVLAGLRPSLTRAAVTYLLWGCCYLSGRRPRGIFLLCFTFLLLGTFNPRDAGSLSFKLSFLALGGILLPGQELFLLLRSKAPNWLSGPLAASFGAQIATAPLLTATFGVLYPVGLVSGLILAPLICFYLWVGIGSLFFLNLPGLSFYLREALAALHQVICFTVQVTSKIPPVYWESTLQAALLAAGLTFLLLSRRWRRR